MWFSYIEVRVELLQLPILNSDSLRDAGSRVVLSEERKVEAEDRRKTCPPDYGHQGVVEHLHPLHQSFWSQLATDHLECKVKSAGIPVISLLLLEVRILIIFQLLLLPSP